MANTETTTMTPEQFAYWLQGCAELNPDMEAPTPAQWKSIKEHLATVFVKVTPPVVRTVGPSVAEPARHPLDISPLAERIRQIGPFDLNPPYTVTCAIGDFATKAIC